MDMNRIKNCKYFNMEIRDDIASRAYNETMNSRFLSVVASDFFTSSLGRFAGIMFRIDSQERLQTSTKCHTSNEGNTKSIDNLGLVHARTETDRKYGRDCKNGKKAKERRLVEPRDCKNGKNGRTERNWEIGVTENIGRTEISRTERNLENGKI